MPNVVGAVNRCQNRLIPRDVFIFLILQKSCFDLLDVEIRIFAAVAERAQYGKEPVVPVRLPDGLCLPKVGGSTAVGVAPVHGRRVVMFGLLGLFTATATSGKSKRQAKEQK